MHTSELSDFSVKRVLSAHQVLLPLRRHLPSEPDPVLWQLQHLGELVHGFRLVGRPLQRHGGDRYPYRSALDVALDLGRAVSRGVTAVGMDELVPEMSTLLSQQQAATQDYRPLIVVVTPRLRDASPNEIQVRTCPQRRPRIGYAARLLPAVAQCQRPQRAGQPTAGRRPAWR